MYSEIVMLITKNPLQSFVFFCTLCPDRLRHGAWVPKPLIIDCPDDEQVDSIGPKVLDCELGGLYMVCHCLPAVTH